MLRSTNTHQPGYTLVELVTAIVVLGILMVPLTVFTINYFGAMIAKNTEAQLATEAQILLRSITEELRTSSAILPATTLTDPNEPAEGWTTSNDTVVIVISTPALDVNRSFITDSVTKYLYQNQIVYYTEGSNLYRRYISNPDAPSNTTVTSCPPASATSTCPADTLLTSNFSDMTFVLYDQDDNVTTDITYARSIIVNVSMKKPTFGRDIEYANAMRMTMRNKL